MNSSLEKQGPLHVFLHKLTDTQSHAESGDKNVSGDEYIVFAHCWKYSAIQMQNVSLQAEDIVSRLREYIAKHPDLIIIDPLDNIRNLRNRCSSYEFIQEGLRFKGMQFKIYD